MKPAQFKYLNNRYIIAFTIFIIWIIFIDDNSLFYQRDLNKQIQKLENKKAFYQKEIEKQKQILKDLNDDQKLQRYAREKLLMKKEGEDIFIIDTTQ
ncbi:MAG TPA: septum formation initiator [Flavobacteriales bacterium]|nr:septum formation initiator [Flavobacteriales bacterium]